ncbi:hypothetical protein IM660_08950 [Ruania alkalisoli]|uniref:Uncharacterized protein n=1 Tax=Ruania alkalisoli TaxID=2779775 RepID=A0A7M1T0C2_9MICO|nr:hypothetical protein [Ruania alkalisoli]QOR72333.1 hypothetical protein IM660_08950 [Ruania alkalisoli]
MDSSALVVGVDIDDVLYDWSGRAHQLSVQAGLAGQVQTITSWTPHREYGCTAEQWWEVIEGGIHDGSLFGAPPIDGAIAALQQLRTAGHQIHLVTARGSGGFSPYAATVQQQTVDWAARHGIPHDDLTFTADKARVRTDYFVDDSADNVVAIRQTGSRVYVMDRPWNSHLDHPHRVHHITEFAAAVLSA